MKRKPKPPKNDLSGRTFGHLRVLRMEQTAKSKNGSYRAICLCDCGKEHETAAQSLMQGRTKSCGCDKSRYEKTRGKNSVQFTGHEEIGGKLWSTIQRRARNRNLDFDLAIEDVWRLFVDQERKCALSSLPLVFGSGRTSATTASLDRIDSSRGYLLGNVQWVHKTVNIMKSTLPDEFFIGMCTRIAANCKSVVSDIALARNVFAGKGISSGSQGGPLAFK